MAMDSVGGPPKIARRDRHPAFRPALQQPDPYALNFLSSSSQSATSISVGIEAIAIESWFRKRSVSPLDFVVDVAELIAPAYPVIRHWVLSTQILTLSAPRVLRSVRTTETG